MAVAPSLTGQTFTSLAELAPLNSVVLATMASKDASSESKKAGESVSSCLSRSNSLPRPTICPGCKRNRTSWLDAHRSQSICPVWFPGRPHQTLLVFASSLIRAAVSSRTLATIGIRAARHAISESSKKPSRTIEVHWKSSHAASAASVG